MISWHNARHSVQITTRAAAARPVTWWRRLPQKLHFTGAPYLFSSPADVIAESGVAAGSPVAITRSALSVHSLQIYAPGPAMSFLTCFCCLPQNEHCDGSHRYDRHDRVANLDFIALLQQLD